MANPKSRAQIALAILGLKPGKTFDVGSNQERTLVNQCAQWLKDAGSIGFRVQTRKQRDGGFSVSIKEQQKRKS